MARILAYTSPAQGHLFPLTPILDELSRRGHEIALRTLGAQVQLMQARGFHAAPISEQVEAISLDDWRATTSRAALGRAVRGFLARAEHDGPDLQQAIAQERPDALLVDINSWGALAAAEAWRGPWATFCPYPLALPSRDVPPFGPGLAPAGGPVGRLRDRVLRPLVVGTIERTMLPALNDVRSRMGLSPLADVGEMFLRPPLLIYMTAEPFEYPRSDWPDSVVMVGPCDWDPPAQPPPWLEEITGPLVLVTTFLRVSGRRPTRTGSSGGSHSRAVHHRCHHARRRPYGPGCTSQCAGGALHTARGSARPSRMRSDAWRHGRNPKSTGAGRASLRRTVRPRSARGRAAGGGCLRRYTTTCQATHPRPPATQSPGSRQ